MDVWSISGRTHYWRFEEPKAKIKFASFSSDGWRVLAVTSRDIVRVWSLGRRSASWTFHSTDVCRAAFAPDGVQVVTISRSHACLWRTDCQQFRVRLPEGGVSEAWFTPDGASVLLTGDYGTSLWNANGEGDCLFYVQKKGHQGHSLLAYEAKGCVRLVCLAGCLVNAHPGLFAGQACWTCRKG